MPSFLLWLLMHGKTERLSSNLGIWVRFLQFDNTQQAIWPSPTDILVTQTIYCIFMAPSQDAFTG